MTVDYKINTLKEKLPETEARQANTDKDILAYNRNFQRHRLDFTTLERCSTDIYRLGVAPEFMNQERCRGIVLKYNGDYRSIYRCRKA